MKSIKKYFSLCVFLCGIAVCSCGQQNVYAGVTGAAFLNIPPDSKASAMGNAYTALADDIGALWWNPSGLARLDTHELTGTHAEWLAGTRYDYIGYAHPLTEGVIGVSVSMLDMGGIESRDEAGTARGNFTARDLSINFAYARVLNAGTRLGITIKFISQRIEAYEAIGYAVDLGGITALNIGGLDLGYGIYNLGPKMRFVSESYHLPLRMSLGLGYRVSGIRIALDANRDYHAQKTSFLLGMEYSVVSEVSLRMGYTRNALRNNSDKSSRADDVLSAYGINAGFGIQLFGKQLDYAFVPYGDLGSTHRISFSSKF